MKKYIKYIKYGIFVISIFISLKSGFPAEQQYPSSQHLTSHTSNLQSNITRHIEDFSPEDQALIRKFYATATAFDDTREMHQLKEADVKASVDEANKIIETVLKKENQGINENVKPLTVADLLTTTFDIPDKSFFEQGRKNANFLLDYCVESKITDVAFFDHILSFIKDPDVVKDSKGRTILMRLADHRGKKEYPESIQCFASVLGKGANINLSDMKGKDAPTIALLANNTAMVKLSEEHLHKLALTLANPMTRLLLEIYHGKHVPINQTEINILVMAMYRVANQSQNYPMVDELYNRFFKAHMKGIFQDIMEAYPFHPPLWAYNMSQIKDYMVSRIKEIQPVMIDKGKLEHVKGKLYQYNTGAQNLILVEKSTDDVGRILGRNHLDKIIQKLKVQDHVAVPLKFLALNSPLNYQHLKTEIRIPFAAYVGKGLNISGGSHGLNPMSILIKGTTIYAEYIEPANTSEKNLMNNWDVQQVLHASGFSDNDPSNFLKSQKDGKVYIIDTEDLKNFLPNEQLIRDKYNTLQMERIKSFAFDPRIEFIDIQLTEKDFN